MKKLLISLVLTCISMASSATPHQAEDTSTVNLERVSAFAQTLKLNEASSQPLLDVAFDGSIACKARCSSVYVICKSRGESSSSCIAEKINCEASCI
ncbi:hypothetical protein HC752_01280 [Vibrio sp. S9_S30]|uniref:hypothetical protein n=1 Tax=Vibrio sp. S9_S30 TaxID=2720226 RepID=UPI00167FF804|nr:hypothetical protein [Vibrio sp. S9_S30]MBD1555566.1 hypothetical protein [Vibrio sp. S9_S30]